MLTVLNLTLPMSFKTEVRGGLLGVASVATVVEVDEEELVYKQKTKN